MPNINWVIKLISKREYNQFYENQRVYCHLGEAGFGKSKQIKIGFLIASEIIPSNCQEATLEEMRQMDIYRRANHIFPTPFEDKTNQ